MSTITTDFRAPAAARPSASRAADGVIAGYVRALAQAAATAAAGEVPAPQPVGRAARVYQCGASRSKGSAIRRRPALRRVPAPA